MILCSRPDQRYARHVDRQIYIHRSNYKFRASSENNTSVCTVYWNNGKGADLSIVVKFVKVFVERRDSAYSPLRIVILPL